MPERPATYASPVSGMVFMQDPGHTMLLASGPETSQQMRGVVEKYSKFAYSTRFCFSMESDGLGFEAGAFDNMLALSDNGRHYQMREHCDEAWIAGDWLFSRWYPWKGTKVETWLVPHLGWHMRIHRITSAIALEAIEGGFAAPRTDFDADQRVIGEFGAFVHSTTGDFSGILDASPKPRTPRVASPHGNTSLMFPRTLVPQLLSQVEVHALQYSHAQSLQAQMAQNLG